MELTTYNTTGDIYNDADVIIDKCRDNAYRAVNVALIQRNWLLGKRIAEEELNGSGRAEYGVQIVTNLSKYLMGKYGSGFTQTNLYQFVAFYNLFPNIFHSLCGECLVLSWSHYRTLLRVDGDVARFSTLAKNDQMFAAKYKLYLPTEEELRREIQRPIPRLRLITRPQTGDFFGLDV